MHPKRPEKVQIDLDNARDFPNFLLWRIRLFTEDGSLQEEKPALHALLLHDPSYGSVDWGDCETEGPNRQSVTPLTMT